MAKTFSRGGIHPPQYKLTSSAAIVDVELPRRVVLMLGQHIGAPARAVVKPGDKVRRADMVGEAVSYMSVPVHTPISGTVKSVAPARDGAGRVVQAVTIEADEADHAADLAAPAPQRRTQEELDALTADDIRRAALSAGLVGLGGATFPLHVKLTPPPDAVLDTLVVNGAECEPFLTCDDALMRAAAPGIVEGIGYAMRAAGASRALVGIEDNKPEAIEAMQRAAAERADIEIVPLTAKYPQGGEKQLINALTGRVVPVAALPASVGCVVMNVASAYSLCRAVAFGEPLTARVLTLTGIDVEGGGNFRVAVGTVVRELLSLLMPPDAWREAGKIIAGGPMMGKAIDNVDAPVRKGTSGLVLLPPSMASRAEAQPCVRCARCVEVCPMGLEPFLVSTLSRLHRFDDAKDEGILNCIECGSCQYVCPSARPLLDFIRMGKSGARVLLKKK